MGQAALKLRKAAFYEPGEGWDEKKWVRLEKGSPAKYCGNVPVNGSKEVLGGPGPSGGHHVPTRVAVDAGRFSGVYRAGLEHIAW